MGTPIRAPRAVLKPTPVTIDAPITAPPDLIVAAATAATVP